MYRYIIPPTGPIILNSSKSNNNFFIMAHFVRKHDVLRGKKKEIVSYSSSFDRCFHTRRAPLLRVL